MQSHSSCRIPIWPVLLGLLIAAMGNHAHACKQDGSDREVYTLREQVEEQNARGYGKPVSSWLKTLTISNNTGTNGTLQTYNVRRLTNKGDWSGDSKLPPGASYSFDMADTNQISLNGDDSSDDIKINDGKGYVEYNSGQEDGCKIWKNIVTWNNQTGTWLINSLFDTIDGHDTVLLPSIKGRDLKITLIDGHNYGTTLSKTFTHTCLYNNTIHQFPLRTKSTSGEWENAGLLWPKEFTCFVTNAVAEISLNGDGDADDLKINDNLGYIEFNLGKAHVATGLFGTHWRQARLWLTQVWFHPILKQWFGAKSWSSINSDGFGLNTTLTPNFDFEKERIIFELKEKLSD